VDVKVSLRESSQIPHRGTLAVWTNGEKLNRGRTFLDAEMAVHPRAGARAVGSTPCPNRLPSLLSQ
jgi:hypothetical protein